MQKIACGPGHGVTTVPTDARSIRFSKSNLEISIPAGPVNLSNITSFFLAENPTKAEGMVEHLYFSEKAAYPILKLGLFSMIHKRFGSFGTYNCG
ncbi:hypothetical protein GCM10028803_46240 [Larkinella knui]